MSSPSGPQDDLWWWFQAEGIAAGFTWRGSSRCNDFSTLVSEEDPWQRLKQRIAARAIVQGEQVHGAQTAALLEGPISDWLVIPGVDALVCSVPQVAIAVRVADCVPVLLWDDGRAVVACVHAGWRGLVRGVIESALRQMANLGVNLNGVHAVIGPAIGPCCYTVREDVAEQIRTVPGGKQCLRRLTRQRAWSVDLPALARSQLVSFGLPADNITAATCCTYHNPQFFFSYRRDGDKAGRQIGVVMLLADE